MERARDILNGSLLWRALMALCAWCGGQWESSGVVQWRRKTACSSGCGR